MRYRDHTPAPGPRAGRAGQALHLVRPKCRSSSPHSASALCLLCALRHFPSGLCALSWNELIKQGHRKGLSWFSVSGLIGWIL